MLAQWVLYINLSEIASVLLRSNGILMYIVRVAFFAIAVAKRDAEGGVPYNCIEE